MKFEGRQQIGLMIGGSELARWPRIVPHWHYQPSHLVDALALPAGLLLVTLAAALSTLCVHWS
jgi:hypothetical protein